MACFFTFFAYISSSPFILQQIYGLSPFHFSLCFALNALTIGIGAVLGRKERKKSCLKRRCYRDKRHIYVNNILENTYSPEMLEKRGIKRFKIFP